MRHNLYAFNAGSRFWKTSKRIRAVRKCDLRKGTGRFVIDSSSDSDFELPPFTCKRSKITVSSVSSTEQRLKRLEDQMRTETVDLKESVTEKEKQLKDTKKRFDDLRQCFECLVCKSSAKSPTVVSPCCHIVLGCEECVFQWLETNPVCPHCPGRNALTMPECEKLPFIRNLVDALQPSTSQIKPTVSRGSCCVRLTNDIV